MTTLSEANKHLKEGLGVIRIELNKKLSELDENKKLLILEEDKKLSESEENKKLLELEEDKKLSEHWFNEFKKQQSKNRKLELRIQEIKAKTINAENMANSLFAAKKKISKLEMKACQDYWIQLSHMNESCQSPCCQKAKGSLAKLIDFK